MSDQECIDAIQQLVNAEIAAPVEDTEVPAETAPVLDAETTVTVEQVTGDETTVTEAAVEGVTGEAPVDVAPDTAGESVPTSELQVEAEAQPVAAE